MAKATGRDQSRFESGLQKLKQTLLKADSTVNPHPGLTPAAVLLPLYVKNDEYHILFTKRTDKVEHHKGHISFPGGAYDVEDNTSLVNTALRETFEEIGVNPADVEVLGALDSCYTTTSNFTIRPFVGIIPHPYRFSLNQNEVAELIEAPVSALISPGCRRDEAGGSGRGAGHFYHYHDAVIWGATAAILKQFLDLTCSD